MGQKDERKLELRLAPPGDEFNSFAAISKPELQSVSHKRFCISFQSSYFIWISYKLFGFNN